METVHAALFRKSPVGLQYTAGLAPDVAARLQAVAQEQTIAQETVTAFYD